ncbi:MAG: amino acid ABC transporter substrate-binding protein, partial [Acidimicrobiia bacterium]|nr:amino acid ABC transporter substrate-binding protein [Acidimicrobiia bacterium]
LIALGAEASGSNEPADIAAAIVEVTRGGEKCSTFAECKELIASGADIDYDGAAGPLEFLDAGEPGAATYDIYLYDADGVQQVTEQVDFAI